MLNKINLKLIFFLITIYTIFPSCKKENNPTPNNPSNPIDTTNNSVDTIIYKADTLFQHLATQYLVYDTLSIATPDGNSSDTLSYVAKFILEDSLIYLESDEYVKFKVTNSNQKNFVCEYCIGSNRLEFNHDYSSFVFRLDPFYYQPVIKMSGEATSLPIPDINQENKNGFYRFEIHEQSSNNTITDRLYIDTLQVTLSGNITIDQKHTCSIGNKTYSRWLYSSTPSGHSYYNPLKSYIRKVYWEGSNDSLYLYQYNRVDSTSITYRGKKIQ